jgi:malate dehydrogenase (oxaloacetate-decarboxylating)
MDKVYQESLDLHRLHKGKLEVSSKVPLASREDLALAYTPGVGQVSVEIGKDKSLARDYTLKRNTIAVVSDGSAILGLGNLGPEAAIPVMEGKAILFKKFADLDAFPICLDTQDVEEIIKAVKLIAPVFGGINLEDISAPRCFAIEERLVKELAIPVMHDDQHGTATVVLAALINALRVVNKEAANIKVVFLGAGASGIATAKLLLLYGVKNIILCDRTGAIVSGRQDLSEVKAGLAEITNPEKLDGAIAEVIKGADVVIGLSGQGVITPEMVKSMAQEPIVFALSNPVPEIMPDLALLAGARVVATGRSDFANQVNNALVFPGIFRGALDNQVRQITNNMLIAAAKNLAGLVASPTAEEILPSIFEESAVPAVASAIIKENS